MWNIAEKSKSSTWRELKIFHIILLSLLELLTTGTSRIDVFGYNWSNENFWIVPTSIMMCEVLKHLDICKSYDVLVFLARQFALLWPVI